jgi:hypothetical protein
MRLTTDGPVLTVRHADGVPWCTFPANDRGAREARALARGLDGGQRPIRAGSGVWAEQGTPVSELSVAEILAM